MTKQLILIVLLCFSIVSLFAQEKLPIPQWQLKVSGKPVKSESSIGHTLWHANVQAGFMLNRHFETGISFGLQQVYKLQIPPDNIPFLVKDNRLRFEAVANLHLLPFLIDSEKLRFDLYLAGKTGLQIIESPDTRKNARTSFFLGAGAAYYLFRQIGVFAEYGYRNSSESIRGEDKRSGFMAGVAIRF
jgi:opacity protein-like surface antigen